MKKLILLTSTIIAMTAQAGLTVFQPTSVVPSYLQESIVKEILLKYPCLKEQDLQEIESDLTEKEIYSTFMSARYYFDGSHPVTFTIHIMSQGSNVRAISDVANLCQ